MKILATRIGLAMLACSIVAKPVSSQEMQRVDSLTLANAFDLARASSPAIRAALARRETAIGHGRELSQYPNPTLEWRRENLGSALPPDVFTTLYLPLDVVRRRSALRDAAAATRHRADAMLIADQRDVELQVARSWFRSAVAQQNVEIAAEQLQSLVEFVRIERERVREGVSAEASLMRMQLEEERVRLTYLQAQIELRKAMAAFGSVLGISSDAIRAVRSIQATTLPEALDEDTTVAVARLRRPEIRAAMAASTEAVARLRAERRSALGGDWQLQGGSKHTGGFMTGQFGIAVPLPIFQRNDGARQRAAGMLAEADALRDDVALTIEAEARGAWAAYSIFTSRAIDVATLASRGIEIAKSVRTSWSEGHASLLELLDAERAAAESRMLHARWMADAWMARLEYERAIGARLGADSPLALPLVRDVLPPQP